MWFIEWTAGDFVADAVDTAAELIELQLQLATWRDSWNCGSLDSNERARIAKMAKEWSDRVLEMSGLVA
jgi:hypothetical protein